MNGYRRDVIVELFLRELLSRINDYRSSQRSLIARDVIARTIRDWRSWTISLPVCRLSRGSWSKTLADAAANTIGRSQFTLFIRFRLCGKHASYQSRTTIPRR